MSTATLESTETTDPVAVATAAVAQAEQTLAGVNERIDGGDETVTADDLLRAETELRIAKGRQNVAQRQAAARVEQARQERIAAIRADLPTRLDRTALEKTRQAMERAIEAYVAACAAYDRERADVWDELSRLGPRLPGITLNDAGYGNVTADGVDYRRARTQGGIAEVAKEAIRRHFPRHQISLDNPQD